MRIRPVCGGAAYVDISIAAILFETWPLFLIVLISLLYYDKGKAGDQQRYNLLSIGTIIFVLLSIAGVALVVLSQNENPNPLSMITGEFAAPRTLFGVFLVLLAAVGVAARGCTLKIGSMLAARHRHGKDSKTGEIVFTMVMTSISMVTAGIVLCTIGFAMSETFSSHQLFYAVMGGIFVDSFGTTALRAANLKTDDLGVNALAYATPLVTLVWLWMLSILNVPHVDYLVIGSMGIVASNLLINAEVSKRNAYKALVVSLLVFGAVIYFSDGAETNVPLELPVTIFILILAFRVDRLARRTNQEE